MLLYQFGNQGNYFTHEADKSIWHQLRLLFDRNGFSIRFKYRDYLLAEATYIAGR